VVRLAGSNAVAWETMVQITQAQGDLKRRDEALERFRAAIASAIDPDVRLRNSVVRDMIRVGNRVVWAVDYFDRTGTDFTRYQFTMGDASRDPESGLVLRTDPESTENWSQTALLPADKPLFHLDAAVRGPGGAIVYSNYQFFVGEPDYDTVRAKVLQILRGDAPPLSGEPGPLFGILKDK